VAKRSRKFIANLACETGEEIHVIERDVREFVEVLKEQRLYGVEAERYL
jgi:hypothetical protein